MNNEQLNTALYEKMFAEQETYRGWLLTQPPEEILKHTYEYTVREDILMSLENNDLTDAQATALLKSPSPLGDVFKEFENRETGYMEIVLDCITDRADAMLQTEREQREAMKTTPVYKYPASYARENDELEVYRASNKANIACKEAIEATISKHYSDNILHPGGVREVVDQFGFERTMYVLANTVRQKDWDGRISDKNKQWAKTITVFENPDAWGDDRNCQFVVDKPHTGLTDLFVNQVRREYLLTQPLSKEEIHMEAARILEELQSPREPNSPNGTHFMAQISPDFLMRANTKYQDKLFALLPFNSLTVSTLKGRDGEYALILKDENRNQPLRKGRLSVLKKLKEPQAPKATAPKKNKEMEL
ncbi:MAG TPA: DUF3849 domain-containing protein [Spirochaetia bacterium]|nr:DUF3849 domain-containing protein [Spirochaetia bacterium]